MCIISDLAHKWSRSGGDPCYLFTGSKDEITAHIKLWLAARIDNHRELTMLNKILFNLNNNLLELGEDFGVDLETRDRIWNPKLKEMMDQANDLMFKQNRETWIAHYLLHSAEMLGIAWPKTDCSIIGKDLDADVCSFLSAVDPTLDVRAERKISEDFWENLLLEGQSVPCLALQQDVARDQGDERATVLALVADYFEKMKKDPSKPRHQALATAVGKVVSSSQEKDPHVVAYSPSNDDATVSRAGAKAKVEGKSKTKKRNEARRRAKAAAKAAAEATASAFDPDADSAIPGL